MLSVNPANLQRAGNTIVWVNRRIESNIPSKENLTLRQFCVEEADVTLGLKENNLDKQTDDNMAGQIG